MKDSFQLVTDKICELLAQGTVPWHKPWIGTEGAFNRISGHHYSLLNQMMLPLPGEYATYDQWLSLGGHVKSGERGHRIVFWKLPEMKQDEDSDLKEEAKKPHPILKNYCVFHISQVEGVEPLETKTQAFNTNPIEEAESVFNEYVVTQGIHVDSEYSDRAYYSPSQDIIHLPQLKQFKDAVEYYSTAFHEAVHSTGIETRLNRQVAKATAFGDESYSREELVAEIGSAFILRQLGIDTESSLSNSASYVYSWLKALEDDNRMIVMAASLAEKAASYILTCALR